MKVKVVISYDEWFPYHDIEKLETGGFYGSSARLLEMEEEDYLIYKGLLLQMERLQSKLNIAFEKAEKIGKEFL
jgi:hypothetical protein